MIELPRRQFLTGLASLMVAPAIVKASSLMPVKSFIQPEIIADLTGLYVGDIITIKDVMAYNRFTKQQTKFPRQFVVTGTNNGFSFYPPMIANERYKNVNKIPEIIKIEKLYV